MRKILDQKFWSHGTPLGHLGPGSQKGLDEMFSELCFPIAIGPIESPDMLVPFPHAENLSKNFPIGVPLLNVTAGKNPLGTREYLRDFS